MIHGSQIAMREMLKQGHGKMPANQKHGAHFAWFTRARFFSRVLKSIFVKRDLLKDLG